MRYNRLGYALAAGIVMTADAAERLEQAIREGPAVDLPPDPEPPEPELPTDEPHYIGLDPAELPQDEQRAEYANALRSSRGYRMLQRQRYLNGLPNVISGRQDRSADDVATRLLAKDAKLQRRAKRAQGQS